MRKKNYRVRGAEPKHYVEPVEVVEEAPVAEKKIKKNAKSAAAVDAFWQPEEVAAAIEEPKIEDSAPEDNVASGE